MSYRLTGEGYVIRLADGAKVPITTSAEYPNTNPDYLAYLQWLDAGNTPDPAPLSPIADRRAAVWEAIKEERSRREVGGIQAGGHWFQTDQDSRIKFLRLDAKATAAVAGGAQSTDVLTVAGQPIYWKTTENGLVPMTVALCHGIVTAVEILDALAYGRAEVLRAQVMASEDPESIDISTGWPAIYQG